MEIVLHNMFKKIKRYCRNLLNPAIGEVWEFHRITNTPSADKRYAPYDITPDRLESVIVEYIDKGYQFVSIDHVCDMLLRMQKQSYTQRLLSAMTTKKFICVTLDDGYEDNYTNAYPIFQKYNIPFCIYVTTSYINNIFIARVDSPPSLKEWQIYAMSQNPLCTIGAHTMTHPNMATLSDNQQRMELEGSIDRLERLIHKKIKHITIPYGSYNRTTVQLVSKLNIRSNVKGWGGSIRVNMQPLDIPRIIVEQNKFTF